jgi:hypothetical protein
MDRNSEGVGVHGHPDYLSHLISAVTLSEFLLENTFLDFDYTPMLRDALLIAAQYPDADADVLADAEALLSASCDNEQAKDAILAIIAACKTAFTAK